MMNWQELEERIQTGIIPRRSRILKADGKGRRLVTSNRGRKIGMRTGIKTTQSKAITYDMIEFAFETLSAKGRFDSTDFRTRFKDEYNAAPCRFSMTGGVLVELGLSNIVPSPNEEACYYTKNPGWKVQDNL